MPILNMPFPRLLFPDPLPQVFRKPFPFSWFSECTPKILVVTDGLNYQQAGQFGLTEFVDTL
jgi:hypothetical protein